MSHDHNHDHEERELITLVDEQGNETKEKKATYKVIKEVTYNPLKDLDWSDLEVFVIVLATLSLVALFSSFVLFIILKKSSVFLWM